MSKEDERMKNMILFKMPVTDAEFSEMSPIMGIVIGIVLIVVIFALCFGGKDEPVEPVTNPEEMVEQAIRGE
jgi:hypothetical protein